MTSQVDLTAKVQLRQKYGLNELSALLAQSTDLPIYSEQTNWEGMGSITEFQICSNSEEILICLKHNKYLHREVACIVGSNWVEIYGFWLGDKAGNTEVLICNISQKDIKLLLDSTKHMEVITISSDAPFVVGGGILDKWHNRSQKSCSAEESKRRQSPLNEFP